MGNAERPEISAYTGEDVPLSTELAKTDLDRNALTFLNASATLGRPITAPPGLPNERVEALRHAFDETMKDPDFLADAAKAGMVVKPFGGDDLQALATELAHSSLEVVKRAKELTGLAEVR